MALRKSPLTTKAKKTVIRGLDCARIDKPHILAVGLFKPLNRHLERPGIDLRYEYRFNVDRKPGRLYGFRWLGLQLDVADMMVYLAILRIVSEQSRQVPIQDIEPDIKKTLLEVMKVEPPSQRVLSAKTSLYEICKRAGYTDGGKNLEKVYDSVQRIQAVRCFIYYEDEEKGGLNKRAEMSFGLISSWGMRDGAAYISINPYMTKILNTDVGTAFVDMDAITSLKSDIDKKLYFWLCGWANPDTRQQVTLDRLIHNVWGTDDFEGALLRQKRLHIREAIKNISKLPGWSIDVVDDKYFIKRPSYE